MSPVTLDLEASKKNLSTRLYLNARGLWWLRVQEYPVRRGFLFYTQDFRSSDGLYNLVKARFPDVVLKGRDLFDASLFRDPDSTAAFFWFISQLKQKIDQAEPTPTHDFLKILESKGKLLRSYTQNIDG
ncbi:uncharacterized protein C8R40DRAFT_1182490, partial [Lentinula edodes]|uniref:uncharacterized protein n=1 Tax=Lentinula edodes TaxID=5353 RepID=UPI001E8E88EC